MQQTQTHAILQFHIQAHTLRLSEADGVNKGTPLHSEIVDRLSLMVAKTLGVAWQEVEIRVSYKDKLDRHGSPLSLDVILPGWPTTDRSQLQKTIVTEALELFPQTLLDKWGNERHGLIRVNILCA